MSLRHLKRLEQQSVGAPEDSEKDSVEEVVQEPAQKSLFQMLAEDGEDDDESPANEESSAKHIIEPQSTESGAKKKKKKKPKNKKKSGKGDQIDEDLEKELRYIEDVNQAPVQTTSKPLYDEDKENGVRTVLAIQLKNLKSENEIYKKFGVKTGLASAKSGIKIAHRSVLLTDPGRCFLRLQGRKTGGVTMKQTDEPNFFEYEYSSEYWETQAEFKYFSEHGIVEALHELLKEKGDHIDTLIQISNTLREQGEIPKAAELIEQAVYILEKAFNPQFSLLLGTCRLDYSCKPNRALFIVLFLYAIHMSLKGCPRTALEIMKAVLSLDPDSDPLAVLLILDHYALRSQEYEWLIELYDVFQKDGRNLNKLPNIAFSVALANFHAKKYDRADSLLQEALLLHPNVVKAIADKNSIMMDKATGAVFDKIYPEDLLVDLYAERCAYMFKEPEVMMWMEKNCACIISMNVTPSAIAPRKKYPRNVLRHISLSNVENIKLQPKHLPNPQETVYEFDPLPPTTSRGDLTPEKHWDDESDFPSLPESTLNNFLNSLNPNWNGENAQRNVAANLRVGVGDLIDAVRELMGNIMEAQADIAEPDQPRPNDENRPQDDEDHNQN